MAKRNLYLTNLTAEDAASLYFKALEGNLAPCFERLAAAESLGRVTREAVYARCCSPLFNAAAMDGIAVVAANTATARETAPLELEPGKDFLPVDTGDPLKETYDAVIMAEDLLEMENGNLRIIAAASPWQHVRPIGEDIVAGEMLVPGNHRIRPVDIGVLLSGGVTELEVYAKPRVAILPTGTEIIEPEAWDDQSAAQGHILESNSRMFEALVNQGGGRGVRFAPLADDYEVLKNAIAGAAAEYDMVLVNAGSSAGREDFTVHIVRELGEVVAHGIAIKPGKPTILGIINGKPVLGLPGYPVSAYVAYENFAAPVLQTLTGRRDLEPSIVEAVMSRRIVSSLKHKEFIRVKLGRVDGRLVAAPLARGAGAAMSLVRSDGFCVVEQNCEGVEAGESVNVLLHNSLADIEHTVVAVGSHDVILDVLADIMPVLSKAFLSSTHVGSLGGLMALKRGEAHVAPIHLLDEDSGEYNAEMIRRIMGEEPCALVKGVGRVQGFMVKPGNPLNIRSLKDLEGKSYINRQRGAGTRVLLDYLLKREGVSAERINGYEREAATHMAVAAAVASGGADAGLGIQAAARALGLDFIPLGKEDYDFAVPARFLDVPHVKAFIETLSCRQFHCRLDELGGYSYEQAGKVLRII